MRREKRAEQQRVRSGAAVQGGKAASRVSALNSFLPFSLRKSRAKVLFARCCSRRHRNKPAWREEKTQPSLSLKVATSPHGIFCPALSRPRLPPGGPPGHAIRRRTARRVQPEAGDRPFAPLGRRGEPRGPRSLAPGRGPTGPRARPGLYRHFRRRNLRLHRSLDRPGTHRTPPDGRRRPLRAL